MTNACYGLRWFLHLLMAVALVSCGGGGGGGGDGGGGSGGTTRTGVFKDANVNGLGFASGEESGFTDGNGRFTFESGSDVTFSVGPVIVGTAPAKSLMTPLDLVTNGTFNDLQVQNIARFLQLLDTDSDPGNGITISEAVRDVAEAAGWSVDFSTTGLAGDLTGIISDIASADARTPVLPSVQQAIDHLRATFFCANSGAFAGRFSGDDNGVFGVLVDAGTGIVEGAAFSTDENVFIGLSGDTGLAEDGSFVAGTTTDGATFEGRLSDPDTLSGSWQLVSTSESGSFSGSRVGGSDDAALRFTGSFETTIGLDAFGFFTFDVDAAGEVSGLAITVAAADGTVNESIGLSGNLTGDQLFAMTDDGDATITGTLDTAAGSVTGTWSDGDGNSGTFDGSGCTLNPGGGSLSS